MSKNQPVTALAPRFTVDLADNAPALAVDPFSETFSWQDIYQDNYWNTENLPARREALGGWPVVTVSHVSIEQVQSDPERPDPNKAPDIVLAFNEYNLRLVCNKTRAKMIAQIAGTPNPALWPDALPPLELYVGVIREMSLANQVLVRPAPVEKPRANGNGNRATPPIGKITVDDVNADLFG